MDFIMAVTTKNVRTIMNEVLESKGTTVEKLIENIKVAKLGLIPVPQETKDAAIKGIGDVEIEIAKVINSNAGKSRQDIINALSANPNISGPLGELNKNKAIIGLPSEIKVADIANSATFNSFVSSPAQNKSNETLTATTPTPPTPTTPSTTPTLTQEQQPLKAQEEAKLKEEAQKKKTPLEKAMEELGKGNVLGAFLAILPAIPALISGGGGVASNPPASITQVTNNQTTQETNSNNPNDIALTTTTQPQTPAQNQQTTAVTPPPATPNVHPKIIAGVYK
jgi:hypothetical protein